MLILQHVPYIWDLVVRNLCAVFKILFISQDNPYYITISVYIVRNRCPMIIQSWPVYLYLSLRTPACHIYKKGVHVFLPSPAISDTWACGCSQWWILASVALLIGCAGIVAITILKVAGSSPVYDVSIFLYRKYNTYMA